MSQASNQGRRRRCPDDKFGPCMEFANAGPFATLLDPVPTVERGGRKYVASPENYTIGSRLGPRIAELLELAFGRERASAPGGSSRARRSRKKAQA